MVKSITLHEPWATLMSVGRKRMETRNWSTRYRGPVVIHAAKTLHEYAVDFIRGSEQCRLALRDSGYAKEGFIRMGDLPLGCALAVGNLVECYPTERVPAELLTPEEREFGNYERGRFAWHFEGMQRFSEPVPWRGFQQLWEYPGPLPGVDLTKLAAVAVESAERSGRMLVHVSREPFDVYIGRKHARFPEGSPWGNPFHWGRDYHTEEQGERLYRTHIMRHPELVEKLPELRGKVLGCWCVTPEEPDNWCHGRVLLKLIAELEG